MQQGHLRRRHSVFKFCMKEVHKKYSLFYLTIIIHKKTWFLHPLVSTCGTLIYRLSRWLDRHLQKLCDTIPTYICNSHMLIQELKNYEKLPSDIKIFNANAVSMYTNFDTDHAIDIIQRWPDE